MSDETLTSVPKLAEPTQAARFSMRTLFAVTAVIAVVAAVVGPLVRRLEPYQQVRLLVVWGVWLAATIFTVAYQSRQRFQAERLAGATLLRLPMFDVKSGSASAERRWMNAIAGILVTLLYLFFGSHSAFEPRGTWDFSQFLMTFGFFGIASVWSATATIAAFSWRNNIRFCEQGLLWDRTFVRWDHIVEYRWSDSNKDVLDLKGINQHSGDAAFKIPVPEACRHQVQTYLGERASANALKREASIFRSRPPTNFHRGQTCRLSAVLRWLVCANPPGRWRFCVPNYQGGCTARILQHVRYGHHSEWAFELATLKRVRPKGRNADLATGWPAGLARNVSTLCRCSYFLLVWDELCRYSRMALVCRRCRFLVGHYRKLVIVCRQAARFSAFTTA